MPEARPIEGLPASSNEPTRPIEADGGGCAPAPQPDELASPGGKVYTLKKGSGTFGYEGVLAPHGPLKGFHARPPAAMTGGKQMFIPGPASKTPSEAALRRAKFMAAPLEILKQDPDRAPKGQSKVANNQAFEQLFADDLEDIPAWVVSQDAFVLWKGGMKPPESAQLSAAAAGEVWRLRAWATAARAKAEQHVRVTALVRHVPEKRQKTVPAAAAAVRSPTTFGEGAVTYRTRGCSLCSQLKLGHHRSLIRLCLHVWPR